MIDPIEENIRQFQDSRREIMGLPPVSPDDINPYCDTYGLTMDYMFVDGWFCKMIPVKTKKSAKASQDGTIPTIGEQPDTIPLKICPEFELVARVTNYANKEQGKMIRFKDSKGHIVEYIIPDQHIQNTNTSILTGKLSNHGLEVIGDSKIAGEFRKALSLMRTKTHLCMVNQTGWEPSGGFLLGQTYIPDTTKTDAPRVIWAQNGSHDPYQSKGNLKGWRDTIGTWFYGNPVLTLSICASIAAPLLKDAEMESFGINLFGRSTIGKTTAIKAAASVWGKGVLDGFVENFNATANGMEAIGERHNDSLSPIDEMSQVDPKTMAKVAYSFVANKGRARLNRDGSTQPQRKWRTIMLSTAETSMEDKIGEDERISLNSGQLIRIIDVPVDTYTDTGIWENLHGFTSRELSEQIEAAAVTHYGHASKVIIEYIITHRREIKEQLKNIDLSPICWDEDIPQVRRVAKHFMFLAYAGQLMVDALFDFPDTIMDRDDKKDYILEHIRIMFNKWKEARSGDSQSTYNDSEVVDKVTRFLQMYGTPSHFPYVGCPDDSKVSTRYGFQKDNQDGTTEYRIFREVFIGHKDLCRGRNILECCRALDKAGLLKRNGRNFDFPVKVQGALTRVYRILVPTYNEQGLED